MFRRQASTLYGCFSSHPSHVPLAGYGSAAEPAVLFSHHQAPERAFAAVLGFEASQVGVMSLEPTEILNPVSQALAPLKVAGSVLVPLGSVPLQGKGTVICGRSPLARDLLTCLQGGRVQSYVRPVGAVHVTAGPDEIRRSGP